MDASEPDPIAERRREAPASEVPAEKRSFAAQVSLLTRLLRKRFDERAREMALSGGPVLTRSQWRMLGSIHLNEGATQRAVAERLEIGPVAAGQTIDRLEKAGWIERRFDPADRRVRRLYVTKEGIPILARLGLLVDSGEQDEIPGLPNEDVAKLQAMLDHVIRSLLNPEAQ